MLKISFLGERKTFPHATATNYLLLVCALAIFLASCGFKLRGAQNLAFQSLYIQGQPSSLAMTLRRALRSIPSTRIEEDKSKAEAVLEIISEQRDKQVISFNPQGQVREFGLNLTVKFALRDRHLNELIPPSELTLSRDITHSDTAVLAKQSEEAELYQAMEEDIAQQILRRVAAIKQLPRAPELPASLIPKPIPAAPASPSR